MLHLMAEIPVKGIYHSATPGKLFKSKRGYELGCVLGHDNFNCGVLLDQCRCQRSSFIRSNSAGDTQKDGFSFQHSYAS